MRRLLFSLEGKFGGGDVEEAKQLLDRYETVWALPDEVLSQLGGLFKAMRREVAEMERGFLEWCELGPEVGTRSCLFDAEVCGKRALASVGEVKFSYGGRKYQVQEVHLEVDTEHVAFALGCSLFFKESSGRYGFITISSFILLSGVLSCYLSIEGSGSDGKHIKSDPADAIFRNFLISRSSTFAAGIDRYMVDLINRHPKLATGNYESLRGFMRSVLGIGEDRGEQGLPYMVDVILYMCCSIPNRLSEVDLWYCIRSNKKIQVRFIVELSFAGSEDDTVNYHTVVSSRDFLYGYVERFCRNRGVRISNYNVSRLSHVMTQSRVAVKFSFAFDAVIIEEG